MAADPRSEALDEAVAKAEETGGRPTEKVRVIRRRAGHSSPATDALAAEEPLEIRLEDEPIAVTMRTPVPGEDAELALGFLTGERIVAPADVLRLVECRAGRDAGGAVEVRLRPNAAPAAGWQRNFYATSSCGICGKASIDAVRVGAGSVGQGPTVPAELLGELPERLRAAQRVFARTGGLHAAGIFDAGGERLVVREDVGRHNAVDKAIGRMAMEDRLPLSRQVLQVSGRASFEIVQKAAMAGIPIVAAVSAPSSLAVRLADEVDMTLVGFSRPGGFNVYCGEERISGL